LRHLIRKALREIYRETQPIYVLAVHESTNSWQAQVAIGHRNGPTLYLKLTKQGPQYYIGGHWVEGRPSVAAEHQLRYESHLPQGVRLAKVILADDEKRLLATEAVPGVNLKSILTKRRPPRTLDLDRYFSLAGQALAVWHWKGEQPRQPTGIQIQRYLDFSVWNVLVDGLDKSITILDFPGAIAMGSAYEDIATFLHSMLVVRHHPLARIKRLTWWGWPEAFAWFLRGYCEAAHLAPSSLDADAISDGLREIVEREKTRYGTRRWNPRYRLEQIWYARITTDASLSSATMREIVSTAGSRRRKVDMNSAEAGTAGVVQ